MKLLALASFLALARANISKGPSVFGYEDKVYLIVAPAVTVNVFQRFTNGSQLKQHDEIILDSTATEFSASSFKEVNSTLVPTVANSTIMEVNFKWDKVNFKGKKENMTTLTSISAKLTFTKRHNFTMYSLTAANVTNIIINGTTITNNTLQVRSDMAAPIGSSFCCSDFGMLKPTKATLDKKGEFAVGLTFPEVRLHVFDVKQPFGRCTDCQQGIPIGFWMFLIITLIFAMVCYYGFSMLASITTNDRWDNPNGKLLQVPDHD